MSEPPINLGRHRKRRSGGKSGPPRDSQRDHRCLELRALGYSYTEIGRQLGIHPNVARDGYLHALHDNDQLNVESVIAQEAYKLYELERHWYPLARAGDLDAFNAQMRIMERRAKLFGLDAPKKFDIRQIVLAWASDNGLDPDETLALVAGGLLPEE